MVSKLEPSITRKQFETQFNAPPKCKNLADFLDRLAPAIDLMQTKKNLQLVTQDLFRQFQLDNVIYAEIRFAPLLHLNEGLTPDEVVTIVEEEVTRMTEKTGIEARIILCTLRHFSEEQSLQTAQLVESFRGTRVAAMDLAADEAGFPLDAHVSAFEFAFHRSLPLTAHAGEAKGPESVRETLEKLKPSRIGHGVRSIEDPRLIKKLIKENIHLEVCPACNVQIDVFDSYQDHPLDRLYRAGVSVGINTDSRTVTDITLSEEYRRLRQVFGWGREDFFQCNANALAAAFLPLNKKEMLIQELTESYKGS
ncbi:MAG: adenosine deaminase [bacterium]|nr:adenosine deaminase [bacterium]